MRAWLRRQWFAVTPGAVALVLGVWGIRTPGPWLDEQFTIEAVVDGLPGHFWEAPMLPYYAFMWLWTGGGAITDMGWLRFPSVIAAVVTVVTVALTTRRLASPRAGLVIATVLALAPGFSRYSQEARTYALAAALVTLSTFALVVILQGGRHRTWVLYVLALAFATPLLPVSLAAIPAHAFIMTGFPNWRTHMRDGLHACLWLLPVVLAEVALAIGFAGIRDWLAPPALADFTRLVTMVGNSEYTGAAGTVMAVSLVVLAALTPMGVRWLGGIAIAGALVWGVSYVAGGWWTDRTFMAFVGILAIAAGLALARITVASTVALLLITAAVSVSTLVHIRSAGSRGVDVREMARVMDERAEVGDRVLAVVPWSLAWWSARHFLKGDTRFERTAEPVSGRYWEVDGLPTCTSYIEWRFVGGQDRLRLCHPHG